MKKTLPAHRVMHIRNSLFIVLGSLLICCAQESRKSKPSKTSSPAAGSYDMEHPEIFNLPAMLNEISGITFHKGNPDLLYAEQDEDGILYSLKPGSSKVSKTKFHKKGDFEDVQILRGRVLVLRSDGVIFSFPFVEAGNAKTVDVEESGQLVPAGEYEGMYADESTGKIYVLCKNCNEKPRSITSGFVFTINKGQFAPAGQFKINAEDIAARLGKKKMTFEPSALGKNPVTGEWFILSSVNKILVIADETWAVKSVIKLDAALYNQPEGLAFDKTGHLYIANERGSKQAATVLKIVRR